MKNFTLISTCFLSNNLLLGVFKKDDNSSSYSGLNTTCTLNSTLVQGTLKITSFIDIGKYETNHYIGY
ncbi:MAG: hypothetical protein IPO70_00870 [Bacteroidetes bacterium]|nr:hypothetical protein [Bacteroidota bacterium]MBK9670817.1 hypothetical protein [Bacteroidota bacterium]MBP6411921.1 hypothetical protein [Bacteroidia bacterium]